MAINRVVLTGRLTAEPELRYTGSGNAVTTFRLAVDRPFANQSGERETDFINITCWRKTAENVAHHLGKGRLVAVDGRLQTRSWEQDGQRRWATDVVADTVQFLDWPKDNAPARDEAGSAPQYNETGPAPQYTDASTPGHEGDDIPF